MSRVTEKMHKHLGFWGPYSKKYSGISRIVDHKTEGGVRFDCVVSPAIENADSRVPNVTVPVGVHPWEAKSDYSFYSYRYDLEWKMWPRTFAMAEILWSAPPMPRDYLDFRRRAITHRRRLIAQNVNCSPIVD